MRRLFLFFYSYRAILLFFLLEIISAWFVIVNNGYQSASFFNSSSQIVGRTMNFSNDVSSFFSLRYVNYDLAKENAQIKKELRDVYYAYDQIRSYGEVDTLLETRFEFVPAKVINNSTHRFTNYLTLDKGRKDGISKGMAVICNEGIVGKVLETSNSFSTVTSVLHKDVYVSAILSRTGTLSSLRWNKKKPSKADLLYVPRHVILRRGDTVVTSGFNSIFPDKIMIGTIGDFNLKEHETFYDITIDLSVDYNSLGYVYAIKNRYKDEIDSLQLDIKEEDE